MITRQSLKLAIESAIARAERIDQEWRREPDGAIRYAAQARAILETPAEPTMAAIQASAALCLIALSCCMIDFDSRNPRQWFPRSGQSKETLFGLAPISARERARLGKERQRAFAALADDEELPAREIQRLHHALRPDMAPQRRRPEVRA